MSEVTLWRFVLLLSPACFLADICGIRVVNQVFWTAVRAGVVIVVSQFVIFVVQIQSDRRLLKLSLELGLLSLQHRLNFILIDLEFSRILFRDVWRILWVLHVDGGGLHLLHLHLSFSYGILRLCDALLMKVSS